LNHKLPPLLALTGLLLIAIGFVSAFIGYNQSIDINYSPLNHFVSELGWEKVNNSAWALRNLGTLTRSEIWPLAILEWMAVLLMGVWVMSMAVYLMKVNVNRY